MLGKRLFVCVGGGRIVFKRFCLGFKLRQLFFNLRNPFDNRRIHRNVRSRLIEKVDCLVGQKSVRYISFGKFNRLADYFVRNVNFMIGLVIGFYPREYLFRVLN